MSQFHFSRIIAVSYILATACGFDRSKASTSATVDSGDTGGEKQCEYGEPYLTFNEYAADMVPLYCSLAVRCHHESVTYEDCVRIVSTSRFTEERCKWDANMECPARECIETWTALNEKQIEEDPECTDDGSMPGVCAEMFIDMDCYEPDM